MDKVGIDTATVAGHSLGGAVTLLLARNHPQKATRLVLIDSVGYPRRAALTHAELVLSQPAARIFFSRESTKAILHSMFYDPARVTETRADAYFNRLRTNGGLNAQEQVAVFLTAESQHGYLVDLAAIQQETLLLWGREDKWIPYKYACCFKKIMPRASLDILPQCGHLLQEEKPAVAAELLYGFLNKTPHQYQTCPCEQN
jgi:pimeloyl-ACP methyl ester carboxylesterase